MESSEAVSTSLVAYAEARAAFARRQREGVFAVRGYRRLISVFDEDWENYLALAVTREIVKEAGRLAEKHGLRGFNAIHLSSAISLRSDLGSPLLFSCADEKLQRAAQIEEFLQPN